MTDGVIADYVTASDEIQGENGTISTSGLLDEVRLYNLYDEETAPEQDAERILRITYPTETLTDITDKAVKKLDSDGEINEGGHVIGGNYGTGKSHIQLVLHHLFSSPEVGQSWLGGHDIDIDLPTGVNSAALQMLNLDRSYVQLWEAVGEYLGIDEWLDSDDVPTAPEIRDAIGDVPTVLFIDEFERWFGMSARADYREDNRAFIQNLLEAAGRNDTDLVVFVAYLFENESLSEILTRTNLFTWDLDSRRNEKLRFLRHRLVGSVDDSEGVTALAKEYADVYRQNGQIELDNYQSVQDGIEVWYPFHPDLLTLLMEKFSEQSSHQDARGLLHFLTNILADTYDEVDLALTGNVDVYDNLDRLRFIDSDLVSRYNSDYHRLGEVNEATRGDTRVFEPFVEELLNIVLLHSLTGNGTVGANRRQMLLGTIRKGIGARNVLQTFTEQVYGHAWHIHRINGEFAFDTEENPAARIEKASEDVSKPDALHRVERLITEQFFDDRSNVHIYDPINTEQNIPDSKSLKVVVTLAAKRDYGDLFDDLAHGREYPNTVVLVTPDGRAGIDTNTGIIELARKVVASERLDREENALPDRFHEVSDQHYTNLHDRVRDKYGRVHLPTDKGLFPQPVSASGDESLYAAVVAAIEPDQSTLRREIDEIVENEGPGGIQYEHLLNDFYRNLAYSNIMDSDVVESAVKKMCKRGDLKVGSYFEEYVGSLGNDTVLVADQYVNTEPEEPSEDDLATITVDTRTTGSGGGSSPSAGETFGEESSGDTTTEGMSETEAIFRCPQCDAEMDDTECEECGFEFDTTDLEEGTVTVEGGSIDELLDQFSGLQKPEMDEPSINRLPAFGALEARNKPAMVDQLERKIGSEWQIHEATITMDGPLVDGDFDRFGLNGDLGEDISFNETLTVEPDSPLSPQQLLTGISNLNAPAKANFEVWLKVEK